MSVTFPKRRRLYLMRHGEVEYFGVGSKPFRPDEVPLTENGQRQAAAAGAVLADVPIDRAYVSPLLRTMQTAELVLAQRDVPIETREALQEIAPGKLRDLPPDPQKIAEVFTGAFGITLTLEDQFLGGETFGSLLGRVLPCLDEFIGDPSWTNLLVVAHGGVNRAILTHALGIGLAGFGRFEQDPACINIIDIDSHGQLLVRLLNFSPTNPAKSGHRLTTMEELLARFLGWDDPGGD